MSSDEFSDWMAYYQLNPFGPIRGDMHAGIIASTFANIHLKKGKTPLTPKDFMPTFGEPERRKELSPAESRAKLQTLIERMKRG